MKEKIQKIVDFLRFLIFFCVVLSLWVKKQQTPLIKFELETDNPDFGATSSSRLNNKMYFLSGSNEVLLPCGTGQQVVGNSISVPQCCNKRSLEGFFNFPVS